MIDKVDDFFILLTHEYALVTQFQDGGNLRRLISENHTELTWEEVICSRILVMGYLIFIRKLSPQGLSQW